MTLSNENRETLIKLRIEKAKEVKNFIDKVEQLILKNT